MAMLAITWTAILTPQVVAGGLFALSGCALLVAILLGFGALFLLVWSIVDIINNPALSPVMKVVLILLFATILEVIGPIIYLLFFRASKMSPR